MLLNSFQIILDNHELVKVFSEHYINVIDKLGGEKPTNITQEYSFKADKQAIEIIGNSYKNHTSVLKNSSTSTVKENEDKSIFQIFNQ